AYSEYVYIHPNAVMHKIGDQITPEVGVLICAVLGNAVRWLRHVGNVSLGDTVALVGPGQQGLAAAAVAKCCGAGRVFLIGLSQDTKRLELAQEFGADQLIIADQEDAREVLARETGGRMADVVMDVTGSPTGAELALTLAGRGGTFVMPGIYKGHKVPLSLDYAVLKEIRMLGVFSHKFKAVQAAISLVQHTRYPFEKMITHRLPLEEAEKAIKLVAGEFPEENPIKVVLDPSMKA
ncbi:MAG: zinc-binding dehydrogenase, partial [Desulfovermiculus sp.]|nr:zinc-binding dehydrogenase [Desulfovermiculus sp.]